MPAGAAREAALPAAERHVDGLIPVDVYLRLDPGTPEGSGAREGACQRLARDLAQYDDEANRDRYVIGDGEGIATVGREALDHDLGHGDIFLAREARSLFRDEILGWLLDR